jgi:hypothetical protein
LRKIEVINFVQKLRPKTQTRFASEISIVILNIHIYNKKEKYIELHNIITFCGTIAWRDTFLEARKINIINIKYPNKYFLSFFVFVFCCFHHV